MLGKIMNFIKIMNIIIHIQKTCNIAAYMDGFPTIILCISLILHGLECHTHGSDVEHEGRRPEGSTSLRLTLSVTKFHEIHRLNLDLVRGRQNFTPATPTI